MEKTGDNSGFTLLEVLISMAIMLVSFASILMVQSTSIRSSVRTRDMITVTMLIKRAMVDAELEFQGKPFSEVKKEENGEFPEPYKDFSWKREIKEVKFPNLTEGMGQGNAQAKGDSSAEKEGSDTGAGDPSSQMMSQIGKLVTKFLSKSIREVVVTVKWQKGKGEQKVTLSQYWVNFTTEFELDE